MWSSCNSYIEKHYKESQCLKANLSEGNYKIPKTNKITYYTFYNYSDRNVVGKSDAKLRYIPYIKDAKDLTGIEYYDELSFKEPVISETSTINTYVLTDIFAKYNDKDMFELKESVKNDEFDAYVLENFPLIKEFMEYTEMPINEIVKIWEEWFDNNSKQLYTNTHTFYNHFCSVCFIFDCGIHDVIDYKDTFY